MLKKREFREKEIENKISKTLDLIESVSDILSDEFEDFQKNDIAKDAAYKRIESAIQNLIDICYIINSDLRLGVPEVEDDIFEHLEKEKTFSKKALDLIKEMKGFRNILVHKYGEIDDKKAFENIKEGLNDFELIIKEIEEFLKVKELEKSKEGVEEKD